MGTNVGTNCYAHTSPGWITLLIVTVITAALVGTNLIPRTVNTGLLIFAYVGLVVYLLYHGNFRVALAPYSIILLGVAFVAHVLALVVRGYSSTSLIAYPFYTFFIAGLNLLVIPYMISKRNFYWFISRLVFVIGIIGVPAVFLGQITIGPIDISPEAKYFVFLPAAGALRSIYLNSNTMGLLAFIGLGCAVAEFYHQRTIVGISLIVGNGILVYLTQSASAIFASIVMAGIYLLYWISGRKLVTVALVSGAIISAIVTLSFASFTPNIPMLDSVDLSSRGLLWAAALDAAARSPIMGYGLIDASSVMQSFLPDGRSARFYNLSPHESYLNILVRVGLVGLIPYALLLWENLLNSVQQVDNPAQVALTSGLFVTLFFESYSIFGVNLRSILLSLCVGYLICGRVDYSTINLRNIR